MRQGLSYILVPGISIWVILQKQVQKSTLQAFAGDPRPVASVFFFQEGIERDIELAALFKQLGFGPPWMRNSRTWRSGQTNHIEQSGLQCITPANWWCLSLCLIFQGKKRPQRKHCFSQQKGTKYFTLFIDLWNVQQHLLKVLALSHFNLPRTARAAAMIWVYL